MRGEQGFALAAVLVLLVGAATVAGTAQISARADTEVSETTARRLILASAIEGAIALAMADLQDAEGQAGPPLDGSRSELYLVGDARVGLRALANAGQVNINIATEEDIAAALQVSGIGQAMSDKIAYAICRRRERQPYAHVVELRTEFGDDAGAFRRVAPLLTTRGTAPIDLRMAPKALQALLKETGPQEDGADAPQAPLTEGSIVTFFVSARLPQGNRMNAIRIMAISVGGRLRLLEDAPYDSLSINALFGDEE